MCSKSEHRRFEPQCKANRWRQCASRDDSVRPEQVGRGSRRGLPLTLIHFVRRILLTGFPRALGPIPAHVGNAPSIDDDHRRPANIWGPRRAAREDEISMPDPTRAVEIRRATREHDDERNGDGRPGQSYTARCGHSSGDGRASSTAALLRVLMEIDRRRLYLGEGCASMFSYCTQVLHMAEGAAYNRIEAARAARSYPVILELFEQSAIALTAVRLLAPHLTMGNHAAVLASATHKSKRQIEELVCSLRPQPEAPVVVRRLPVFPVVPVASLVATTEARRQTILPCESPSVGTTKCEGLPAIPPARIVPIAPARYRIQVTVSRRRTTGSGAPRRCCATRCMGRRGRDLRSGPRAPGRAAQRQRSHRRPRTSKADAGCSRHIPAAVRRAVWRRDAGRCAFVGGHGRCAERHPRVPPRRAVCRGRRGDRTEHRVALPRAQRLRGAAVLRGRGRPVRNRRVGDDSFRNELVKIGVSGARRGSGGSAVARQALVASALRAPR